MQLRRRDRQLPTSTYPPLCDRSVLLPDRPELMDSSVGDCLSAMLQEDMLMGSDRPYGSRLSAEGDITVRKKKQPRKTRRIPPKFFFGLFVFLPFTRASSSCRWCGGLYGAAPAANASETNPSRKDREESTWKTTTASFGKVLKGVQHLNVSLVKLINAITIK